MKKILLNVLLAIILTGCATTVWDEDATVGIAANRIVLPNSQTLTPVGKTSELPGMRPVTVSISPDGKLLATSGKTSQLVIFKLPVNGKPEFILLPAEAETIKTMKTNDIKPDKKGQISYTGLIFSPDGKRIYLSNVNGSVKVFSVLKNGNVKPMYSWKLPGKAAPRRDNEIPAGLAVSSDGKRLYVCGSLSNKLLELDTATGKVIREIPVGMIPYQVVLNNDVAYVSNRAGTPPKKGDSRETAGRGVDVRVEGPLSLVAPGTISVIDLKTGKIITEIKVGKQPGAIILSPDKRYLIVANADDDTLSIIDTQKLKVKETLSVRWKIDDPFGASPTAMTFINNSTLAVCLGTQNTLALFKFINGKGKLFGMIPTAWFPSGVVYDKEHDTLHISNLKGFGSGANLIREGKKSNSRSYFGTISHIPLPDLNDDDDIEELTEQVLNNYRIDMVRRALLPPRPGKKPVPVPERSGEPSVFKHVIYIIRENRTYDQVLGDVQEGRGDKNLCIFGEKVTPNIHKLVREFVLLDNIYCSGILSADGHNWCLSAFANDYLERSFAGWPRSYPDGFGINGNDVMAWSPQGFLWSVAANVGKSVRVYGEMSIGKTMFTNPNKKGTPSFSDFYNDYINKTKLCAFTTIPAHKSVAPFLATNYPSWSTAIPDQIRADIFIKHLKACERGESKFENLHIISLINNHTTGTKAGYPVPEAAVADNDLALGRIVEAITKSSFWSNTCIFSIEDDPQAGWDHISGFRTDCQIISPYTKRGKVISKHFNQPGLVRTIGLILGFPPMNQMDAGSTPLRECFTATPDFSTFNATPNKISLTKLNPEPSVLSDTIMKNYAKISAKMPFNRVDACNEDLLNHILWAATKGPNTPYPDWAIVPPNLRGADDDDD